MEGVPYGLHCGGGYNYWPHLARHTLPSTVDSLRNRWGLDLS